MSWAGWMQCLKARWAIVLFACKYVLSGVFRPNTFVMLKARVCLDKKTDEEIDHLTAIGGRRQTFRQSMLTLIPSSILSRTKYRDSSQARGHFTSKIAPAASATCSSASAADHETKG